MGSKENDTARIEGMVERFEKRASDACEELNALLEAIKAGAAPTQEATDHASRSLNGLRTSYIEIREASLDSVLDSPIDLPADGAPAKDYLEAVRSAAANRAERQLERIRATLTKFLLVRSNNQGCMEAIKPLLESTQATLSTLNESDDLDDEISRVFRDRELFLDSLDIDFDQEENDDLAAELNEAYPFKVYLGVTRHQYYVADGDESPNDGDQPSEIAITEIDVQSQERASHSASQAVPASGTSMGEDKGGLATEELENLTAENQHEEVTHTREPAAESLAGTVAEGDSLSSRPEDGLIHPAREIQRQTPKAKGFLNDIDMYAKVILPMLTKFGLLDTTTVRALCSAEHAHGNWPGDEEHCESALKTLTNKGIVAEFDTGCEKVYCLTSYGLGSLMKPTVRNKKVTTRDRQRPSRPFWPIQFGEMGYSADGAIDAEFFDSIVSQARAAALFLTTESARVDGPTYRRERDSVKYVDGVFQVDVLMRDENDEPEPITCTVATDPGRLPDGGNVLLVGFDPFGEEASGITTHSVSERFGAMFMVDTDSCVLRRLEDGWRIARFTDDDQRLYEEAVANGEDPKEAIDRIIEGSLASTEASEETVTKGAGNDEDLTNGIAALEEREDMPFPSQIIEPESAGSRDEDTPESISAGGGGEDTELLVADEEPLDTASGASEEEEPRTAAKQMIADGDTEPVPPGVTGTGRMAATSSEEASPHRASNGIDEPAPATEGVEHVARASTDDSPDQMGLSDVTSEKAEPAAAMAGRLVGAHRAPADEDFVALVDKVLSEAPCLADDEDYDAVLTAATLLRTASFDENNVRSVEYFKRMQLATRLSIPGVSMSNPDLAGIFDINDPTQEDIALSAYCLTMLSPIQQANDSVVQQRDWPTRAETSRGFDIYEKAFPSYSSMKSLYHSLMKIFDISDEGFSSRNVSRLFDDTRNEERLRAIVDHARNLADESKFRASMPSFPSGFATDCYGRDSKLGRSLQIVSSDARSEAGKVKDILNEYCNLTDDGHVPSPDKIGPVIDATWVANDRKGKKPDSFNRSAAFKAFVERLEVMRDWLDADTDRLKGRELTGLKKLRSEILERIEGARSAVIAGEAGLRPVLVLWALRRMQDRLEGVDATKRVWPTFARTGFVRTDDRGMPLQEPSDNEVKYYEPWRNTLRHIAAGSVTIEQAEQAILDPASPSYDNLHQLSVINRLRPGSAKASASDRKGALANARKVTNAFQGHLEMSYLYMRINEPQRESIGNFLNNYRERFFESEEYGSWRQFTEALRLQIDDYSSERRMQLSEMLSEREDALDEACPLLEAARTLLEEKDDLAIVEEYINRYDAGERDVDPEYDVSSKDVSHFKDFMSDTYDEIYGLLMRDKGKHFESDAKAYVRRSHGDDWQPRDYDNSNTLVAFWSKLKTSPYEQSLGEVLRRLGFNVANGKTKRVNSGSGWQLHTISSSPTPRNERHYKHPVAMFGTQMAKTLNVLVIHNNMSPNNVLDLVFDHATDNGLVVMYNYPLSIAERRRIAQEFREKSEGQASGQQTFLLVDQVLLTYIVNHERSEWFPLLLECTLPFTYYQPFSLGTGNIADEMFFGRTRELDDILSDNGVSIVYGGRQLGKSALLQRAESRANKPDEAKYALYASILDMTDEGEIAQKLADALSERTRLRFGECDNLGALCGKINSALQNKRISSLLLLIDEADKFLDSIRDKKYAPINTLVELQRAKKGFRFVLAGTHDVCRYRQATEDNGVFGQLSSLCIEPMSPSDAMSLISHPLEYLGFDMKRYPQLETILANTNFYPGILQYFGYKLVQTMREDYRIFYQRGAQVPPYELKDRLFGRIMAQSQLNSEIKKRFMLTLDLDDRYHMIARVVALLYYEKSSEGDANFANVGFLGSKILSEAHECDIICLENEDEDSFALLLDELVRMGILFHSSDDGRRYRLKRYFFLNLIGPNWDTVFNDIDTHNHREPQ